MQSVTLDVVLRLKSVGANWPGSSGLDVQAPACRHVVNHPLLQDAAICSKTMQASIFDAVWGRIPAEITLVRPPGPVDPDSGVGDPLSPPVLYSSWKRHDPAHRQSESGDFKYAINLTTTGKAQIVEPWPRSSFSVEMLNKDRYQHLDQTFVLLSPSWLVLASRSRLP